VAPRASTAFEMQINETDDGRYTYFYDEVRAYDRMPGMRLYAPIKGARAIARAPFWLELRRATWAYS